MEHVRFLGWNNIGKPSTFVLFGVLSIMYALIFMKLEISKTTYVKAIRSWLFKCHIECEEGDVICEVINNNRGGNYGFDPNIDGDRICYKNCKLIGWEYSHFLFHMFLGLFYNIYISQSISITFELYEARVHDCGSLNDIVINLVGYLVGYIMRIVFHRLL